MVNIANPIYDSVFKYLMEDERIAKTLISALLKKDFDQSLKEKGNHQVLSVDEDKFNGDLLFISKPSRQLPDDRKTANYLSVRILRRKTRQSDSFWEILCFTKNQRYWQLLIISISLKPNKKGLDNRRVSASPIIQSLFYVQTRGLNGMFLNVTSRASYRSSHRCQGEER